MKNNNKQKPALEPVERAIHRAMCKHFGYYGYCSKHSGQIKIGNTVGWIDCGCDGKCRRMTIWDNKNGYKGVEFDLRDLR